MGGQAALAAQIASQAHAGQLDKAGRPYAGHVRRTARIAEARGLSDMQVAAAWLHDVVEDAGMTLEGLRARGVDDGVLVLVDALTCRLGERRDEYLRRLAAVPGAADVKRCDVADNTDPQRMALLEDGERARLAGKYARTLRALDRPTGRPPVSTP